MSRVIFFTASRPRRPRYALTTRESEEDEDKEGDELHDVHDHPAERDLERPQVRVHAEDVDELEVGEDVGRGEKALRDQHRVPGIPMLPWEVGCRATPAKLILDLKNKKKLANCCLHPKCSLLSWFNRWYRG